MMRVPFINRSVRNSKFLSGRSKFAPACVLVFLISLAVGFGSGFPDNVLRERMVQELTAQTGLTVSSDSLELRFPATVKFDLTVDPNQAQIAPLVFKPLQLQPVWASIFSSARAAVLNGQFSGGDIEAQIGADDHLQLEISGVRLGPLQKTDNPYRLDGVFVGRLDGQQISQPRKIDAFFSAEVSNLTLFGLEQLSLPDQVALGQLSLQGKLKGQRLTLEKISLDGTFASLNGSGTLQLGANPRQTRLNLRMSMTPGQSFPESLKPLIELSGVKPKADGSYQFRIAGTLATPVLR